MNETIGVKGGKNDRKRTLRIAKKNKEKLDKYYSELERERIEELEKKVGREQVLTFFKVLPIVAIGNIYTAITEKTKEEKEVKNLENIKDHLVNSNLFEEERTEEIAVALDLKIRQLELIIKDPELQKELNQTDKMYFQISDSEALIIDLLDKNNIQTGLLSELNENEKDLLITGDELNYLNSLEEKEKENLVINNSNNDVTAVNISNKLSGNTESKKTVGLEVREANQTEIPMKKTGIFENIELEKIKNRKIVEEYDKKLKDVRLDLRRLIFEYNAVSSSVNNVYDSNEIELLLDRLNFIIKKIEELKMRIELPDVDRYDDNYLYVLVSEYIEEFKNKQFVDEIKDSSLYILISEKLDELDQKKDFLTDKIEEKKEKLQIDEENLERLKSKYFDYEKFNLELLNFQSEQDMILRDIKEKLQSATSVYEKTEIKIQGMTKQSKRLLKLLALQMMLPGIRSAKGLATTTATYLYFMKNVMNPKTITKKYKVIEVKDYSKEIESSLQQLDGVSLLLAKTSKQINKLISSFKQEYREYFGVIPDCDILLRNLEKVQDEMKEKEYELEKIKYSQKKNLEENKEKMKTARKIEL